MKIYYCNSEKIIPQEEKETRLYQLLNQLSISYDRVRHEPLFTMNDYSEVEEALGNVRVYKNLFLANRQQTKFYLLLMVGDKPFKTKELSAQIQSARLSFGSEEKMLEYLHVTKGSCTPLALMEDQQNHVEFLIDSDVVKQEYVGLHPLVNTSTIKMKTKDLLDLFLNAVHHSYKIVDLKGE